MQFFRPRILIAGLLGVLTCLQAAAAPLQPILACRQIKAPDARLECFDREAANLAKSGAETPGEATASAQLRGPALAAPRAGAQLDLVGEFGLAPEDVTAREAGAGLRPKPLDHLEARVTSLGTAPDGLLIFRLDNGQVWKQVAREGELLANAGDQVRISRGWLNSYLISLPSKRSCKVRRLN